MKTITIQAEYTVSYETTLEIDDKEFETLQQRINDEDYEEIVLTYIDFRDHAVNDEIQEDDTIVSVKNEDGSFSQMFPEDF